MSSHLHPLKKFALRLASPDILFWVMPFFMILLVVGTIAQKDIGILTSQQTYFASYVYTLGFVPLPGGITLISILFINLLAKFLFKSEWSWKRSGTIITHFGILILIVGGLLSYVTSKEGYLMVQEGASSATIEDYHQRVLVVKKGDTRVFVTPYETLSTQASHATVSSPAFPFQITITKACYNCGITKRPEDDQDGWHRPGRFMQLVPKDKDPQDEKNMTGIEFIVTGAEKNAPGNATGNEEEDQNGKYLTFDKFPKPPHITATDPQSGAPVDYTIAIERATRDLPFTITLEKFTEDFHPGTDMARAFQSKIIVTDGATSWPALIQMNQPLRYRGYTLYQSSFDMSGDKPYTILTVVENKGRIFPYIATIIIAFGLILHLGLRLGRKQASHA